MKKLVITNFDPQVNIPVGTVIENFKSTISSGYTGYNVFYKEQIRFIYLEDAMTADELKSVLDNLNDRILSLETKRAELYNIAQIAKI